MSELDTIVNPLTGGRVILEPKVDVLLYSKAKATSVGKVLALELILLHLEPSLKDLQGLFPTNLGKRKTQPMLVQWETVYTTNFRLDVTSRNGSQRLPVYYKICTRNKPTFPCARQRRKGNIMLLYSTRAVCYLVLEDSP